ARPLPIDPQKPSLQAHGCPATYAALRSEGPGANGCRSPRDSTRDASRARAAALTTSRAKRERITPNRSTWRGWVRIANMIAWENIASLLTGGPLRASGSLHLGCQAEARDVRRRGGRGGGEDLALPGRRTRAAPLPVQAVYLLNSRRDSTSTRRVRALVLVLLVKQGVLTLGG